ncbi:MAG: ATP-dependent Clp protease proteolytic subunit [Anaerolineae bacterium]|nr:ATP-dependent Clp protease proteolytic subunit [Anaerolineae bacterium]
MSRVRGHLILFLLFLSLSVAAQTFGQSARVVKVARFEGPVTPVLASYIERSIEAAEAQGAAALVIELDTPGGSVDITKTITQRMTAARVPVIVYVAPSGAHAGSAGTFITLAGHLAAMAPGSSIGAASPVGSEGQDLDETLKAKATNILVADIKNLAERRGDKAVEWAGRAVSEAAAATAQEALSLGVIDAVAADLDDLLRQLDGKTVSVAGEPVTLDLGGAETDPVALSPLESLLNQILFELSSPGGFALGIFGAVCVLIAFYALGTINANWTGLAFVILAVVLFILDIKAPTHGALTVGGIASFVFGLYLLYNTSDVPVPWGPIVGSALATAAFFAFAVAKVVTMRRRPAYAGMTTMVGQMGVVRRPLEPEGMVLVNGELWQAESESGPLPSGAAVIVTRQDGIRLWVRPA